MSESTNIRQNAFNSFSANRDRPYRQTQNSIFHRNQPINDDYNSHFHSRYDSGHHRFQDHHHNRNRHLNPTIDETLIAPVSISPITFSTQVNDHGETYVYLTTSGYVELDYIRQKLELSGTINNSRMLFVSSLYVEFATHTMAHHAVDRIKYVRVLKKRSRLSTYHATLKTKDEIDKIIETYERELKTVFSPSKCLCIHGINDQHSDLIEKLLEPFNLEGPYEIKKNLIYTYHTNAASVRDFYFAFQEHHSGVPNTYVTEEPNRRIIDKICNIVQQRLVDDCVCDLKSLLHQDIVIPTLRRAQLEAEEEKAQKVEAELKAKAQMQIDPTLLKNDSASSSTSALQTIHVLPSPARQQPLPDLTKYLNFYIGSSLDLCFYLSPLPKKNIRPLIKKEIQRTKRIMLDSDSRNYERTLSKQMEYETTFESIKQPEIQNGSSRLTPIHKIEEWHKRNYLRPYAEMRRRKFTLARKSGLPILKSQFVENETGFKRGVVGKRVYFEKSEIQGYGLFALEPISPSDFICEYTGQLIRMEIADRREKKLAKRGFQHMYLFRMGEYVIDATEHGSNARFLNHSCSPNCRARQISIEEMQTISFFATKTIKPHDEIAFDYEMELERDPAKWEKCYCGSKDCNGYLNYSVQRKVLNRMYRQANEIDDENSEDFP